MLQRGHGNAVQGAEKRTPFPNTLPPRGLKIIKLGMETRQVIARFEAERQALALMDHPNITKVFDAGVTERPLTESAGILPAGCSTSTESGKMPALPVCADRHLIDRA